MVNMNSQLVAIEYAAMEQRHDMGTTQSHPDGPAVGFTEQIAELRLHLELLGNCEDDQSRALECKEFLGTVQSFSKSKDIAEKRGLLRQALALDMFLDELCNKPACLNASITRTLSLAIETLEALAAGSWSEDEQNSYDAVVIDGDMVSSTASCNALRKVDLTPHLFGESSAALQHLCSNGTDLIVLDMTMATAGEFSLYKDIRALPQHSQTPVIFLSSPGPSKQEEDPLSHQKTQFLAKPYTMLQYRELALKACSRVLKSKMGLPTGAGEHNTGSSRAPSPCLQEDFSELQESHLKLHAAHAELGKELEQAKAALQQEQEQRKQLENSLQELRAALPVNSEKQPLGCTESSDESESSQPAQIPALEATVREGLALRARATADLEQARGDRRRAEQRATLLNTQLQELHAQLRQHLESETATQNRIIELEQRLQEKEETLNQVNAEMESVKAEHELAQKQLLTTGELTSHLRDCVSSFELAKQSFKRTQEEMESRLQANLTAASEAGSKLRKEMTERQRLEEALVNAERRLTEQSEQSRLQLSQIQSALEAEQAERTRSEGQAIQARYANLDSERASLVLVNKLRTQMSHPMDKLMERTRHLLELQLDDEARQLLEGVLENALLLQASLQEAGKRKETAPSSSSDQPAPESVLPPSGT